MNIDQIGKMVSSFGLDDNAYLYMPAIEDSQILLESFIGSFWQALLLEGRIYLACIFIMSYISRSLHRYALWLVVWWVALLFASEYDIV